MKIIKKNQLTILVLALMLVTAGYLNYNNNIQTTGVQVADIGDATLVSSNISNSIINQNESTNTKSEVTSNILTQEDELQINSQTNTTEEYFNSSRLERDTMYSEMLESYQKIVNSTTVTEKQKTAAQKEIDNINKAKNSIMISENLIKTKGISDLVIFLNDNSISVVVKKEELKKEEIAQIQSIIAREMNAKIENIHIMNK